MIIDHVTIAGPSLKQLEALFANLGLTPDYGGAHSNGVTHMSLLGFEDGSYIELISAMEQATQKEHKFWGRHIEADGGPCAWAIFVDDVAAEAERVAGHGVTIDGPHYSARQRPDGQPVEWNFAFLGDKAPGATLPFVIKDITPRKLRVQPSASVAAKEGQPPLLAGIDTVILGVKNLEPVSQLFQTVYGWSAPSIAQSDDFGARLANFSQGPVTLAAPLPAHPWLARRLAQFDESPCGYLIGTTDFETACRQFDTLPPVGWFGRRLAWLNPDKLNGIRLALIEK